uniref:Uncharacterized protein n=1 Tax=Arundo donax TaxID=35708 RepID=A0A0A9EZ38_ARUDO
MMHMHPYRSSPFDQLVVNKSINQLQMNNNLSTNRSTEIDGYPFLSFHKSVLQLSSIGGMEKVDQRW